MPRTRFGQNIIVTSNITRDFTFQRCQRDQSLVACIQVS